MTPLVELWLPILVSSVVVFIFAMLAWTAMPHHKGDIKDFDNENEDKMISLIKSAGLKPGWYMFPSCRHDSKYAKSDEFKAKWEGGCIGNLTIFNGAPNMGRNMLLSMIVYLFVGVFVAYLTGLSRAPGADGMAVMQVAGTAAFGFYFFGSLCNGIWFGQPLRAFITNGADALVYAVATGLIFMFLWPAADAALGGAIPTP